MSFHRAIQILDRGLLRRDTSGSLM